MTTLARIGVLAASVAVVGSPAAAGGALATPSMPVKIEVKTILTRADHPGTFTTSGAGLCRRGTSKDRVLVQPRRIGNAYRFHFGRRMSSRTAPGRSLQ